MRKSLKRIAAGLTAVATVSSLLLTVSPVHASSPATLKDTLSREKVSTDANHTLAATVVPTWGNGESLVFDYGASGFSLYAGALAGCSITTGTCSSTVSSTNTVVVTCTATNGCSGTLGFGANTFAGANPGSSGSKSVTMTANGASGVTGSYAIPIVDSDQVTVTATVSPSITFDIDTGATAGSDTSAPYTVALGTITTADGRVTGSTDGVNFIGLDLNTNASGGAVVTVSSTNSALKSTSVPADTIPSSTATMANGTSNYGICVISTAATTGTMNKVAPYASTCAANSETNSVGGVTTAPQAIVNSNSLPISAGRAEIAVNAAISGVQPAHNDYTDILKFIATGTF